jgi:hypothetical protein
MDLAAQLGMTVGGLKRSMTEQELVWWSRYAATKMLPARRLELYLAQIAMMIAQTMGGAKNVRLRDFLFDPPDDEPEEVADVEAAKAFFGFKPRKRKAA